MIPDGFPNTDDDLALAGVERVYRIQGVGRTATIRCRVRYGGIDNHGWMQAAARVEVQRRTAELAGETSVERVREIRRAEVAAVVDHLIASVEWDLTFQGDPIEPDREALIEVGTQEIFYVFWIRRVISDALDRAAYLRAEEAATVGN